ncbi:hypothetical protein BDZ97DRAFT_834140 [Flammula alnicola]|nr:hypothetical protein BDZ97DRAFT_834140 [Flammula alnicola]
MFHSILVVILHPECDLGGYGIAHDYGVQVVWGVATMIECLAKVLISTLDDGLCALRNGFGALHDGLSALLRAVGGRRQDDQPGANEASYPPSYDMVCCLFFGIVCLQLC